MNIKKLSLLLLLLCTFALSMHAGQNDAASKQKEYERDLILKWGANMLTSGAFGKSVPFRIAGMVWLGYEASNYIERKHQNTVTLSDLKIKLDLPFYNSLNLDLRCAQEQYIKNLQLKNLASRKINPETSDKKEIITPTKETGPEKKQVSSKPITIEFKKGRYQHQKLPESISFDVKSNAFDPNNTLVSKALLSSKHVIITDGINRGFMRKHGAIK